MFSELPQNTSTSVTNMAEYLAPELIQRHFPHRFEELPPAIFLEHYGGADTTGTPRPEGNVGSLDLSLLGTAAGVALRPGANLIW